MVRFANSKLARMSNGRRRLIRDLGLVKVVRGCSTVVWELSLRGLVRFATTTIQNGQTKQSTARQQEAAQSISYRDGALKSNAQLR
jgi:hypothetical protein